MNAKGKSGRGEPISGAHAAATNLYRAVAERDRVLAESVMTDDVSFYSPAFAEPARGRDRVVGALMAAATVYRATVLEDVFVQEPKAALFFDAEIDGHQLQVCYRLTVEGTGKVARVDALMRPVEAMGALVEAVMRHLQGKGTP